MTSNNNYPLVSVVMITYCHEPYIRAAIEGVLMQQYKGDIELIIANDRSPDNTGSVVKEIIQQHKNGHWIKYTEHDTNLGMTRNFCWALQQCKGKYIALCEGDDYWIDDLKLQKQVDFLEAHTDFSFCAHSWLEREGMSEELLPPKIIGIKNLDIDQAFEFSSFNSVWFAKTLTLLYRKDALDFELIKQYKYSRDMHVLYHAWKLGKGYFMKDVMGVYRIHKGGVASMIDLRTKAYTSYEIAKELHAANKDEVTRRYYLFKILGVLKGRIFTKDMFGKFNSNIQLVSEAIKLQKKSSNLFLHL